MNLVRKCMPNSGSIKIKAIIKLFHRLLSMKVEHWNDKEITTTLTVPGTVKKIWSKILGNTSVTKLVNKCGCFKQ